jgi:glucose-1-phosphate thymidylyltransferase
MKGLILAGGNGTRLFPITVCLNKHFLPIYDKPMIFYPLAVLLHVGITDITIICNETEFDEFQKLTLLFKNFDFQLTINVQKPEKGIPSAIMSATKDALNDDLLVILGDNLFHANSLAHTYIIPTITKAKEENKAAAFSSIVKEPENYGVTIRSQKGDIINLIEKPQSKISDGALTGLYFFPKNSLQHFNKLKSSSRGETEIIDVLLKYLKNNSLIVTQFGRGVYWIDAGQPDSLFMASDLVRTIQERQGLDIGNIEEIALEKGLISSEQLKILIELRPVSKYNSYILKKINETYKK